MYLVGARFERLDAANAAIAEIRRRIQVQPGDLGLRPLGSLRYEQPARALIVAGRFGIADVAEVTDILRSHGGEIVFRRPEWRQPPSGDGGGDGAGEGQAVERPDARGIGRSGGRGDRGERGPRCQGVRRPRT